MASWRRGPLPLLGDCGVAWSIWAVPIRAAEGLLWLAGGLLLVAVPSQVALAHPEGPSGAALNLVLLLLGSGLMGLAAWSRWRSKHGRADSVWAPSLGDR